MHIPAIRDGDIAFGKGGAVKAFTAFFIGAMFTDRDQASVAQFDETEALGRKVESAMKAPAAMLADRGQTSAAMLADRGQTSAAMLADRGQTSAAMRPLFSFASFPAFGTVVPSSSRMRRPSAAGVWLPQSSAPARCSIQGPHLRRRLSNATLERSASPMDAAQALVNLNPMPPKQ
jgi:hypothetical protein